MGDQVIKIDGLNEFVKTIKQVDRDLPKALRLAFNEAAQSVVDDAAPRIPSRGGNARRSVKARSTQKAARVVGGGTRAPYYPWLDFGGKVGKKGSVVRPYRKRGRYIYYAYYEKRDSGVFQELLSKGLIKVASQAGLEVT